MTFEFNLDPFHNQMLCERPLPDHPPPNNAHKTFLFTPESLGGF